MRTRAEINDIDNNYNMYNNIMNKSGQYYR